MMDLEDWKLLVIQAVMIDLVYIIVGDDLDSVFSGTLSLSDAALIVLLLLINGTALYALVTELTG